MKLNHESCCWFQMECRSSVFLCCTFSSCAEGALFWVVEVRDTTQLVKKPKHHKFMLKILKNIKLYIWLQQASRNEPSNDLRKRETSTAFCSGFNCKHAGFYCVGKSESVIAPISVFFWPSIFIIIPFCSIICCMSLKSTFHIFFPFFGSMFCSVCMCALVNMIAQKVLNEFR